MMGLFEKIPYLDAYANPQYFVYLLLALFPIAIGLLKGKRLPFYEWVVNLLFICFLFGGDNDHQLIAFLFYCIWQTACVWLYKNYRKNRNSSVVFYLASVGALFPLLCVKLVPLLSFDERPSLLGFIGISYLTFKTVGMIIEMRDGTLTDFSLPAFLRFLIFLPTFTSGPIDRFRRFESDYQNVPDRDTYLTMLDKAVMYLMLGALYKFIISYLLGGVMLPIVQGKALSLGGYFNLPTVLVMYLYGLNLFFDFAGYSMFAIAISYIMGIKTPENFHKPFLASSLKDFWNRWHMTLSFWFRDYVFMRLVHTFIKNKTFKNRNHTSSAAYLINMLLMGFWHGLTWYYIAYGLFHGIGLIINDAWLRKKKALNRERKKAGLAPRFESKFFHVFSIIFTFHVVMFSLLIFSGFLNDLWFTKLPK
ncbi:D-alanyl-lipoteichoic acid biosynthesis protein DltB [Streptococcus halichoeri]|uniref:D-alanyl-lipoteichoic acid biosynthesis protein DltB n=1 Tax=Streptococcus halichoeri TaxID=254785 RepID=UPI00135ADD70|nr:D-alanyl-lipoteichoic acid biosynthesis protein DltB [Streptococcus halichoeri]